MLCHLTGEGEPARAAGLDVHDDYRGNPGPHRLHGLAGIIGETNLDPRGEPITRFLPDEGVV